MNNKININNNSTKLFGILAISVIAVLMISPLSGIPYAYAADAPIITSVVADDPDDADNVYSTDDTITITFDSNTNEPGGTGLQTKTAVNGLFTFTESLGQLYNGKWITPDTFIINIKNVNNAGPPDIGSTTVTPAGTTPILSADGTSVSSTITSPVLSGDYGELLVSLPSDGWIVDDGVIYYNGGNVGIGTDVPEACPDCTAKTLQIKGVNAGLRLTDTDGTPVDFQIFTNNGELRIMSVGALWPDEGYVMTPNGNVGIGTDAPSEKLEIKDGNIKITNENLAPFTGASVINFGVQDSQEAVGQIIESTKPITYKGYLAGVDATTLSTSSIQAGIAQGRLGISSVWFAGGGFFGVAGLSTPNYLATFDSSGKASGLGGYFIVSPEDVLDLGSITGTSWVGGVYGEVDGTINNNPANGAVAGVIGIDNNQGTADSHAGYFYSDENPNIVIENQNKAQLFLGLQDGEALIQSSGGNLNFNIPTIEEASIKGQGNNGYFFGFGNNPPILSVLQNDLVLIDGNLDVYGDLDVDGEIIVDGINISGALQTVYPRVGEFSDVKDETSKNTVNCLDGVMTGFEMTRYHDGSGDNDYYTFSAICRS